jgi:hypothetical protein
VRLAKFFLVCGASIALVGTGCEFHPDPTENIFYVKVLNDTSHTVILSICATGDGLCTKAYDSGRLKPGGSWPSVQTSVGALDPVLVRNLAGKRLGCVPIFFDYNATGSVVRVSELVPCAKGYSIRSKPGTS